MAALCWMGGCSKLPAPASSNGASEDAIETDVEEALARRARAQRYFELCAVDEPSYRAIQGLAAGSEGALAPPPAPCREFWALKRDFRLEYDCLQPTKPAACDEYFARKRNLGL